MNDIYETKITNGRWIACDLPGNAGWIIYFFCCVQLIREGFHLYTVLSLIPALFMLIGIIELISERIAKLDRVLPQKRLWRGFGALTLGGILGMAIAIWGLFLYRSRLTLWMLLGSFLCALFAGLLLYSFEKR